MASTSSARITEIISPSACTSPRTSRSRVAVTAERGDARLRQGHVEEHHALAPAQKLLGERGADEPRAPRDESRHGPTVTSTSVSR